MTTPFKNSLKALLCATVLALSACGGGSSSTASSSTPSYGGALTPGSVTMTVTHHVTITTTLGTINIGLDGTHAPLSTANFLAYVKSGAYVNTVFHRVVAGFVVQGGGFTDAGGTATAIATTSPITLESRNGLSNTAGTIGMARTSDPNSATSQFYVNLVNNASTLDYPATDNAGYAVFGMVMDNASLGVINAIAAQATTTHASNGYPDWPVTDVTVTAVTQVD
ncbi:peptidylprolyl isomerase [Pelomonas sp. KK5]|uniref:peptidylprolyl isomerase n=1 Tax=Pelomonas sp. KK5 TaxID=1855730 RepID=UPI00097BD5C8|nr:peptidylprolyl isomerase [Pelomonas sp. KK5]